MRLQRRSSYLAEFGWYLGDLILAFLELDIFAMATVVLLGTFAYIFIPILCADGIIMGIMLSLVIAGSSMAGIAKFIALIYVSRNAGNITGNFWARFDNLTTGKPNTFVPQENKPIIRKFPCKYALIPECESDKAEMRRDQINWWFPSEAEKRRTKTKTLAEKYVIAARWKEKGYIPGWQSNEFTND